jgi:predicted cupin superfamily sugar epimerase
MSSPPTSAEIIVRLELRPHPEGGHYRETFRDSPGTNERARSTAIYFLLARGERSHWHRIDVAEVWHYYAGDALTLQIANDGCRGHTVRLGPDIAAGERPQAIVPASAWQAAESTGDWTLVGCTVAPGFEFAKFELAKPDWSPPR